jgi:dienelactone hydrolase
MTRIPAIIAAATFLAAPVAAQQITFALPPTSTKVTVTKNVVYGRADTTTLRMDVYRPEGPVSTRRPTLVFFNRAFGAERSGEFYSAWARAAASRGLVAILPDIRGGTEGADFTMLVRHLVDRGSAVGVDPEAISVYAASGNAFAALPVLEDPAMTSVKSAVIYYGASPIKDFRLDLPVLVVRAGLDRPDLNRAISELVTAAVAQNAPVTLLNHAGGYHGFEMYNNDDATRAVMEETIAFVRRTTSPSYLASVRAGIPEATAAGAVQIRDFAKAVKAYAPIVAQRPDDARLRLSYGEALLGDAQFAAACGEFEKLKGKGLGPRDLGLPAARACMGKGDADAAIAWLKTIPTRFLPPSVQDEVVFASIKTREDFRALFGTR